MKRIICLSILMFFLCTGITLATSPTFELEYWLARGQTSHLKWTVLEYGLDPHYGSGQLIHAKSELKWDTNKEWMILLKGKMQFSSRFFVNATCGIGAIQQGVNTDTDWLFEYSSRPWILTRAPSSGSCYLYNLDANLRVLGTDSEMKSLNLSLGFGGVSINTLVTDPLTYVWKEWVYLDAGHTYPGLNTTYDIVFRGIRLGVAGTARPIEPFSFLEFSVNVGYFPIMSVQGKGFWNLRDKMFYQSGIGNGLEYNLGISTFPTERLSLGLSYESQLFKVTKSDDWETCQMKSNGFFASATYRF